MQPKKLEQYKYFQPIAWTICVTFAGFVMMLAFQLQTTIKDMEKISLVFDQRLQNVEAAIGIN